MNAPIYFVDLAHDGTIRNADTFPLGVGNVAAYAAQVFGTRIRPSIFKYLGDLNGALRQEQPRLLACSNYVWNAQLTHAVAQALKRRNPHMPVIMGGPNISYTAEGRREFLRRHPWVDFYICNEGERAFVQLLSALYDNDFDALAVKRERPSLGNVIYIDAGEQFVQGPDERILSLAGFPSPYTSGLMDKFFAQHLWPLIEFTRGCPYSCTFCTDAQTLRNRLVRRAADETEAELAYIADHLVVPSNLLLADLNFGMYKDDLDIARQIRRVIDQKGWPHTIYTSLGKSHPDRVMEVARIINGSDSGIMRFAASFQSTDPEVLGTIRRKNLTLEAVTPIVAEARTNGIDSFTELILGLPGETFEKHLTSLRDCIDGCQMSIVNVHQLTILEGSPMAAENHVAKFGLQTAHRVFVGCIGDYDIDGEKTPIAEFEQVVTASDVLSHEQWLQLREINLLVKLYIDRDQFIEILGPIREMGLSVVDLIAFVHRHAVPRSPQMAELLQQFRAKTLEPLFDDREELERFVKRPGTVERFRSGELGGNELVGFRAMLNLRAFQDIHDALLDGVLGYMRAQGQSSEVRESYFRDAIRFSQMRKFFPLECEVEHQGSFSFDLEAALERRFRILPDDLPRGPFTYRFFYDDAKKADLDYALRAWVLKERGGHVFDRMRSAFHDGAMSAAQLQFSFGKLYHNASLQALARNVQGLSPAATAAALFGQKAV
jgi:radical SAM superfamily enzyme YgiQ (UPF0313 family)